MIFLYVEEKTIQITDLSCMPEGNHKFSNAERKYMSAPNSLSGYVILLE